MAQGINGSGGQAACGDCANLNEQRACLVLLGGSNGRPCGLGGCSACRWNLLCCCRTHRLRNRFLGLRRRFRRGRSCWGRRLSILILVLLRCRSIRIRRNRLQRGLGWINGGAGLSVGLRIGRCGGSWVLAALLCAHQFGTKAHHGGQNQAQDFCASLLDFHNAPGNISFTCTFLLTLTSGFCFQYPCPWLFRFHNRITYGIGIVAGAGLQCQPANISISTPKMFDAVFGVVE